MSLETTDGQVHLPGEDVEGLPAGPRPPALEPQGRAETHVDAGRLWKAAAYREGVARPVDMDPHDRRTAERCDHGGAEPRLAATALLGAGAPPGDLQGTPPSR